MTIGQFNEAKRLRKQIKGIMPQLENAKQNVEAYRQSKEPRDAHWLELWEKQAKEMQSQIDKLEKRFTDL